MLGQHIYYPNIRHLAPPIVVEGQGAAEIKVD